MDYFETMKSKADERCKQYFKTFKDLQEQLPKAKKRLEKEQHNAANLKERLAKLQELSVESLAGDENSFQKYKTSMKKLQNELEVSEEIIQNVESNILPAAKGRLEDAKRNLGIVLRQIILETRKDADATINELLRQCVREYDKFLEEGKQLFQEYGLTFIVSDESYCPSPWSGMEIRDMKLRLGMTESHEPTQEEIYRNYHRKITDTPKDDTREPCSNETPSEPAGLPPETLSPVVEPEPPTKEAVGETSEPYDYR